TVFGEVVDGMEVVDKIAAVETGQGDVPKEPVRMKVKVVE
ncbi:MAG: peptidylprolyl isomerase, partial [Bacteroidota bacterium]